MSNRSLKKRIRISTEKFKVGEIDLIALKDSIGINGRALEMMPYEMIKQIDEIEYKLTVSQFADEEDCYTDIEEVLKSIDEWLTKIPIETEK